MFWKQSEGGLKTEGTCSARLWGREWAKRLLPTCLSGYGAVLMDFGGHLSGLQTGRCYSTELWRSGAEEQRYHQEGCQKIPGIHCLLKWPSKNDKKLQHLLEMYLDISEHEGWVQVTETLESCSSALTGNSTLELYCTVLYPIEGMWLIHLTCGHQMLDLRRERA